jgi:hypothetical protein
MARVKMEEIVEHLSSEMRRALGDAAENTLGGVQSDEYELFRASRHAVARRCHNWEIVPDRSVETD